MVHVLVSSSHDTDVMVQRIELYGEYAYERLMKEMWNFFKMQAVNKLATQCQAYWELTGV